MQGINAFFLEDWLRICSSSTTNRLSSFTSSLSSPLPSSSPSATVIIQAWSQIRNGLQSNSFQSEHLQFFQTLRDSQASLRIADAQAKLLLSVLSFPFPPESSTDFYRVILRLLYVWVRKSPNASVSLLDSAVSEVGNLLSSSGDEKFFGEGVLFLGAVSAVHFLRDSSRKACLEVVQKIFAEKEIGCDAEVMGGVGYCLFSCERYDFERMTDWLLSIWDTSSGFRVCVNHGLLLFHLMEWLVYSSVSSGLWEKMELLLSCMTEKTHVRDSGGISFGIQFALVMSAGGVLRGLNRGNRGKEIVRPFGEFAENIMVSISSYLMMGKTSSKEFERLDYDGNRSVIVRCIAICICRSGSISFHPDLLNCLLMSLLHEVLPLVYFYDQIMMNTSESSLMHWSNKIGEHLDSILFKEAGIATRFFCNFYVQANEEQRLVVESCIWRYCEKIYSKHRQFVYTLGGKHGLVKELEKIAEAAFLMVIIFASTATKHKVENTQFTSEVQLNLSWCTLSAFSCVEYFRRVRISEYGDTVKRTVLQVKDNFSACLSLVETVPSYAEITNQHGWNVDYSWSGDKVQTARVLFYLRVLLPCAEKIPTFLYQKILAPVVFLYMQHPDEKVARASHSLFVAFISSGKDSLDDQRPLLKEKLAFYYIQRALEAYPGATPFEGMASGVVALIRHLPAGCPALFYCVHEIVEKAKAMNQRDGPSKSQQECSEPCKKLLEFLPRLVFLVDIQVLPSLLKLLAQLIVHLQRPQQAIILDELYAQVAESDDVTRKPLLVSWLQSVTYLSAQDENNNSNNHIQVTYSPNRAWWSYFFPGSRL